MSKAQWSAFRASANHIKEVILFCRQGDDRKADSQYHEWMESLSGTLYPRQEHPHEGGLHYDVHVRPSAYLPCMIYINTQLELWGARLDSPLCLRSSLSPQYIKIDTGALVDLLMTNEDLHQLRWEMDLPKAPSKGKFFDSCHHLIGRDVSKEVAFCCGSTLPNLVPTKTPDICSSGHLMCLITLS